MHHRSDSATPASRRLLGVLASLGLAAALLLADPSGASATGPSSLGSSPADLRAESSVLSIDPAIAHDGDPVTVVAPGCDQQVRFVVTDSTGATVLDSLEPPGTARIVFTVPAGAAGTALTVSATCVAPDGTTTATYQPGQVSVVGAGADATISADPTTVTPGATTTIAGSRCVLGGSSGLVDLLALGQSFSFPAASDGSWSVTVQVPVGTSPGVTSVNARCRAFGGTNSFEYADVSLTVERPGGLSGSGGGIAGSANPVPSGGTATPPAARVVPPVVATAPTVTGGSGTPAAPTVVSGPATPVPATATYVG